ncbi:Putative phosphatase YitU [Lactobacillus plantarum] [Lactiplantibacillus mudanjiangensis]|uniref:Cof-type HAD-IIB family hydrolase n=1 Tax=Lactiplantibacillus mudanjiangensis TaxID=1296538 RepID=UPI0010150B34|nr:Cof-type HAD-IIB family hydrolase [Lactiplantibacillus mudanjiangensis]VDG19752.1 Putative phosphatase YitU [Lactobacillus plantarum] [Lactiplantibacillus mudanjiangensis]VDG31181.1 Putative phosphatase YitU [Lactobacillus plantarum] [Lactiplantibacillus mudanjiangensis]
MERKLIALDLDGTTLNETSRLNPATIQTMQRLQAAGHIVSIITGRSYQGSQAIYDELKLNSPMINFNGSLGHLPHQDWAAEYQFTLNKAVVLALVNQREQLGINQIIAENKNSNLTAGEDLVAGQFFPEVANSPKLSAKTLTRNPNSLVLIVKPERRTAIIDWIKARFDDLVDIGVWGGPNAILEITSKGVHKARGMAYLAEHFHISRQNIIAFGDEHNDLEMLQYAGLGVAMTNGTAAVKTLADDVTSYDNAHDGVARYLTDYFELAE